MLSILKKSVKRMKLALLLVGVLSLGVPTAYANTLACYNSAEPGVVVCYSTGSSAGPYHWYYDTVTGEYWY